MAAAATKNIQLALALPARLRTFLARYPPASILPAGANPETHRTAYQEETPNPFLPMKHPVTGRWHDPKYSLRRQAELVKLAREHGVEELLPYTPKGTETRLRKRVELGLRVKGTGVGQKVKGHKHERQLGVKYVWIRSGVWLGGALGVQLADSVARQDGEEERGHAEDAGTHQRMEEGMFWGSIHALPGIFADPSLGWETGLDQVPEISGQKPSGDDVVMCLDCTNTNVQHSTTGWFCGCGPLVVVHLVLLLYVARFFAMHSIPSFTVIGLSSVPALSAQQIAHAQTCHRFLNLPVLSHHFLPTYLLIKGRTLRFPVLPR
jgi:large subunit ribosomal protein L25